MHVVYKDQAPFYEAPGHEGMLMQRLQGREAGPSGSVWLGLSVIEPGGMTTLSASAVEKFYVVIDGELEISGQLGELTRTEVLHPLDSCRIAPLEARRLVNRSERSASVLLVMPETQ